MLKFSVNTLVCKDDIHFLDGFLQYLPLGCEVNIMFTEGSPNTVQNIVEPIETLSINGKEILKRQDDDVGGSLKLYKFTYMKSECVDKFSFSEAKNALLDVATRGWIINIDADERLMMEHDEAAFIERLPREIGGVKVHVVSYTLPSKYSVDGSIVTDVFRIFRNDKNLRFKYRVHEDISEALVKNNYKTVHSTIVFRHRGYEAQNPEILIEKTYRNLAYLFTDLAKMPYHKGLMMYAKRSLDKLSQFGEIP